jgi:uncharacterized protein YbjT (DUF2867 family)
LTLSTQGTEKIMNILLCGASGFIGQHILQALTQAGHRVVTAGTRPADQDAQGGIQVDFNKDITPGVWLPRLQGIEAVVNAVGVLRDSRRRPMQAIHEATPKALFDACAQAGVRRVIQISALGIEGNPTPYARTKLAADAHLMQCNDQGLLNGVVLRPSIVFGKQGESSRLFMTLARSPALLLPRAVIQAKVQPLAVQDLAHTVTRLLGDAASIKGILPCVGPSQLTLSAFIACLRTQLGKAGARVLPLPEVLTQLSVRMGDHVPGSPWCSETLALLAQDNIAAPQPFNAVLGRGPVPPTALLRAAWT